jgi:N-acetylglucosaminyldiphosphoundecaprenol N-acetyl-beta-D-mannosaminyltransferase
VLTNNINILGISYCSCDEGIVLDRIDESVGTRIKLTIGYSHFFHVVLGRNDSKILDLYRKYDLVLPDGYGVYIAGKFLHGKEKAFEKILNGTDLYELLLKKADLRRWRIFFLGETENVLEALKRRLHDELPGLVIAGTHHGFVDLDDETVLSAINASNADILLIGMGAPKQDYWLWKYYHDLRVPVIMTVGAGIRFISGEKIRAPKALRSIHMEWLFRFFQEPRRLWRRYFLGIPKFMFYIFLQKVGWK